MEDFIDFSHFTAAKNTFEDNPGLCNLFKFLAIETWKRIEFTYIKPYIKVYETTLTQNIAFTINAYINDYPNLPIEVWEADDEKANGNDLEIIIAFSNFAFDFYAPVQAKKIYRDERYIAMDHGDQIEKLITYAEDLNGYPLYLLYNFVESMPHVSTRENELYGCSIVDAYHLRDNYYNQRLKRKRDGTTVLAWNIPNFNDLHPEHGFPWHELVCNTENPLTLFETILNTADAQRKTKYRLELLKRGAFEATWQNFPGFINKQKLSFIGWFRSNDKDIVKTRVEQIPIDFEREENIKKYTFNPKTRIVITIQ